MSKFTIQLWENNFEVLKKMTYFLSKCYVLKGFFLSIGEIPVGLFWCSCGCGGGRQGD